MRILWASAFLLATSGWAAASATAAPPDTGWAGPYVGIGPSTTHISASTEPYNYQITQVSGITVTFRGVVIIPGTTRPAGNSASASGTLGTVRAGYAWQSGRVVWGLEADYGSGSGSGTSTTPQPLPPTALSQTSQITSQRSVALSSSSTLRARIGVAAPRDLVYVTGGPAWASATIGGTDSVGPYAIRFASAGACPGSLCQAMFDNDPFTSSTSQRQSHTGTVVGVGWTHRVSRSTTIGLEYTRTSLGSRDYLLNDTIIMSCSETFPGVATCPGPPAGQSPTTASPHAFTVTTTSLNLKLDVRLR